MRVGRFQAPNGSAFWAVLDESGETVTCLRGSLASWAPQLALAPEAPPDLLGDSMPLAGLELRAPVEPGGRIFGISLNYAAHVQAAVEAAEAAGRAVRVAVPPEAPGGFVKTDASVVDPGGSVRYPFPGAQLDYGIELVVVVARPVERDGNPFEALLGYTVGDDGSVRGMASPMGGPDLVSQKARDASSPIGPWITTLAGSGGTAQPRLELETRVNGVVRQRGTTADMTFSVDWIVRWINARNRLRPGDLIYSGTPPGTALEGVHPWLRPGDRVEMTIEAIGALAFTVSE